MCDLRYRCTITHVRGFIIGDIGLMLDFSKIILVLVTEKEIQRSNPRMR